MTHEYAAYWRQPDTSKIRLTETHAFMDEATFKELADYSCSYPSGVYEGKMWKRRRDYYDASKGWMLVWYGPSDKPKYVSNNYREIVVEGERQTWPVMCGKCANRISAMLKAELDLDIPASIILARYPGRVAGERVEVTA